MQPGALFHSLVSSNPFEPPTVFPFAEFAGLVYRVLEVLETNPDNTGGLAVLRAVRTRVVEAGNRDLLERVDRRLTNVEWLADSTTELGKPNKSLRKLVTFISESTDPGSVFVLRRTDRLGDREKQEELIRKSLPVLRLWFAPERFGQRSPAMAFVQVTEEIAEGAVEIEENSVTVTRFVYDR